MEVSGDAGVTVAEDSGDAGITAAQVVAAEESTAAEVVAVHVAASDASVDDGAEASDAEAQAETKSAVAIAAAEAAIAAAAASKETAAAEALAAAAMREDTLTAARAEAEAATAAVAAAAAAAGLVLSEADAMEATAKAARVEAGKAETRRATAERSLAALAADLAGFVQREREHDLLAAAAAAEVKTLEVACQDADAKSLDAAAKSEAAFARIAAASDEKARANQAGTARADAAGNAVRTASVAAETAAGVEAGERRRVSEARVALTAAEKAAASTARADEDRTAIVAKSQRKADNADEARSAAEDAARRKEAQAKQLRDTAATLAVMAADDSAQSSLAAATAGSATTAERAAAALQATVLQAEHVLARTRTEVVAASAEASGAAAAAAAAAEVRDEAASEETAASKRLAETVAALQTARTALEAAQREAAAASAGQRDTAKLSAAAAADAKRGHAKADHFAQSAKAAAAKAAAALHTAQETQQSADSKLAAAQASAVPSRAAYEKAAGERLHPLVALAESAALKAEALEAKAAAAKSSAIEDAATSEGRAQAALAEAQAAVAAAEGHAAAAAAEERKVAARRAAEEAEEVGVAEAAAVQTAAEAALRQAQDAISRAASGESTGTVRAARGAASAAGTFTRSTVAEVAAEALPSPTSGVRARLGARAGATEGATAATVPEAGAEGASPSRRPAYAGPALDFTIASPLPPGASPDALRLLAPAGRATARPPGGGGAPLVYIPGLDGSGEGVRLQVPALIAAGYDVRCLKVPVGNREGWPGLTRAAAVLLRADLPSVAAAGGATVVAESFFAPLALMLAAEAPELVSRLVLINPAVNSGSSDAAGTDTSSASSSQRSAMPDVPLATLASAAEAVAGLGLLELAPGAVYDAALQVAAALAVETTRVGGGAGARGVHASGMVMPGDGLPPAAAAWRLSLWRAARLPDRYLHGVAQRTLIVVAARDRVLPSLQQGARLARLLPNAARVVFADSGHALLLEDDFDLAAVMDCHGIYPPGGSAAAPTASSDADDVGEQVLGSSPSRSGSGAAAGGFEALREARARSPVAEEDLDVLGRWLEPWKLIASPAILGTKNLPDPIATWHGAGGDGGKAKPRPILFVGNHSGAGALDLPLLVHELHLRGYVARALAHPAAWFSPLGAAIERFGGVKATPYAAYRLLKEGSHVLLFPGGNDEVGKGEGGSVELRWKAHADFVRMAARFDAIIVPFAALGAEDAGVLNGFGGSASAAAGPLLEALFGDPALSEVGISEGGNRGLGIASLVVPSLQRVYFKFGAPLEASAFVGGADGRSDGFEGGSEELAAAVRESVMAGIAELEEVRRTDPQREFSDRAAATAQALIPDSASLAAAFSSLLSNPFDLFSGLMGGQSAGPSKETGRAAGGRGAREAAPVAGAESAGEKGVEDDVK